MTLRRVEAPETPADREGIFGGLRVLDLSTGIAGPYATMLLADHGANVAKVEPPGGDPYRSQAGFQVFNRGKRSAVLDLTSERGRRRSAILVRWADVMVVDVPQPRAARIGVDYESARAENPGLVYLGLPPYGERGPYVDRAASPGLLQAANGMMASQMSYSGDPVHLVLPLAEYGTAAMGAAAIAGGLYARERWGIGQFLEVSQLAGSLALQVGGVRSDRVPPPPFGPSPMGARGRLPAYRLFQAGDGKWFFLACGSLDFFNRMLIAVGRPDLAADPRLENAPWGLFSDDAREALVPVLEEAFATKPREHWVQLFREADVPAQPVLDRDEYFASHVVKANAMRQAVDHPSLGRIEMMGVPLVMEAAPGEVRGPAPRLGEHTDEVLGEATAAAPPVRRLRPDDSGHHMLEGVRVIDLTSFIAGPVGPRHLAMLGADVTKVEAPLGDVFRQMGLGFLGWNQGKRGIALDLRKPEGREVLHRMAAQSDVVVENYRPGVAKRLGIDHETLRALNPRLIYLSSPGWGDDEAMSDVPAFDPLVQALSGAMATQGGEDEPVFYTVALNDVMTPALATFGILAALYHRERTGEGQLVQTALARTGLAIQAAEFTRLPGCPPLGGFPAGGRDFPGPSAGQRWYRCGDGRDVYVEATSPAERKALATAAGAAVDPRTLAAPWGTEPCRTATEALAGAFGTRPLDEWVRVLDAAEVPCNAIVARGELLDAAHLRENELVVQQEHPLWGTTTNVGMLIQASATPGRIDRLAPELSEHAAEILDELGYAPEERTALATSGAVVIRE